jgi:hypothetical protein
MNFDDFFRLLGQKRGWRFQPGEEEGTLIFTLSMRSGRKQEVHLRRYEHDGHAMVRFTSVIGPAMALTGERPAVALRLNSELPFGCLAIEGEHLVVTDTFLLDEVNLEEVLLSLNYLAQQADRYERMLFGTDRH